MRDVPRARRQNSVDGPICQSADGMVSDLPPEPRTVCTTARVCDDDGLPAGRRPGRDGSQAGSGIQDPRPAGINQLFDLPPMSESPKKLDLAAVRTRLEKARGREYWRSLEDLAATPGFRDLLER